MLTELIWTKLKKQGTICKLTQFTHPPLENRIKLCSELFKKRYDLIWPSALFGFLFNKNFIHFSSKLIWKCFISSIFSVRDGSFFILPLLICYKSPLRKQHLLHPVPKTQTHLVVAKLAGRTEAADMEEGPFLPSSLRVSCLSELLMKPYQWQCQSAVFHLQLHCYASVSCRLSLKRGEITHTDVT